MKSTILLVDDDEAVLMFVAAALGGDEFAVSTAASAEEALARLDREDFDVVVTDYRMPGKYGDAVVSAVREKGRRTGIILMTGLRNDLPEWLRTGPRAVRILDKPFSLSQLLDAVGMALGASRVCAPSLLPVGADSFRL